MASKAFAAVAASLKNSKNLDSVIVGAPALGEGTWDVTIQAVDTSALDDDKLNVTFADAQGRTYTDRMFLLSADKTEFGYGLRGLWSGLFADKNAILKLVDMTVADAKSLEIMTGMKLRITLKPGKGIQARSTGMGTYAGFDVESGTKATEDYTEIKAVYEEVKAKGLKRSYFAVRDQKCTHKDENLAAFKFAVDAKEKAATGTVSQFSAGKAV